MGCYSFEIEQNGTCTETFKVSDIDLSIVKAIQVRSGITGYKILLKEKGDVEAIINAVKPLCGSNPVSSRGKYGWLYDFMFYDTASPTENDVPVLNFALHIDSSGSFLSYGLYEVVEGHSYSAMYTVDTSVAEQIVSLCSNYIE